MGAFIGPQTRQQHERARGLVERHGYDWLFARWLTTPCPKPVTKQGPFTEEDHRQALKIARHLNCDYWRAADHVRNPWKAHIGWGTSWDFPSDEELAAWDM